jgi:hypothetical protein
MLTRAEELKKARESKRETQKPVIDQILEALEIEARNCCTDDFIVELCTMYYPDLDAEFVADELTSIGIQTCLCPFVVLHHARQRDVRNVKFLHVHPNPDECDVQSMVRRPVTADDYARFLVYNPWHPLGVLGRSSRDLITALADEQTKTRLSFAEQIAKLDV